VEKVVVLAGRRRERRWSCSICKRELDKLGLLCDDCTTFGYTVPDRGPMLMLVFACPACGWKVKMKQRKCRHCHQPIWWDLFVVQLETSAG
jgi:predicted RNA-binding Zn-ribbon protein involved in translation (DUF1610 family)